MTKKEQQRYDRQIDEIADNLMIDAHREAFNITDKVYLDILLRLQAKICVQLERLRELRGMKKV